MLNPAPSLAKTWTVTVCVAWILLWLVWLIGTGGGTDADIVNYMLASAFMWSMTPFLAGLFLGAQYLGKRQEKEEGARAWIRVAWIFGILAASALGLFLLRSVFPRGGAIFFFAYPPLVLGGVAVLIHLWRIRNAQRFDEATEDEKIQIRKGRSFASTWSVTVWSAWFLQWFLLAILGGKEESGVGQEVVQDAFALTAIPAILGFLVVAFVIKWRAEKNTGGDLERSSFGLIRISLFVGILAVGILLLGRLEPGILVILSLVLPPMVIGSLAVMIRLVKGRSRLLQ